MLWTWPAILRAPKNKLSNVISICIPSEQTRRPRIKLEAETGLGTVGDMLMEYKVKEEEKRARQLSR